MIGTLCRILQQQGAHRYCKLWQKYVNLGQSSQSDFLKKASLAALEPRRLL